MKYILILLTLFLIPAIDANAADPIVEKLQDQDLPQIKEPDIEIVTLSHGVLLYYLQDEELPIMRIQSYFQVGKLHETYDERGLAGVFFLNWRSGGSLNWPAQELDEKLEFLAANISTNLDAELSSIKMTSLLKDADEVLPIYFDVMQNPVFDEERLQVNLNKAISSIPRRNEDPYSIASREFSQSLLGEKSPYAWLSNESTLKKITSNRLKDFHKKYIGQNGMMIAASSPLSRKEFVKKIEPYISRWKTDNKIAAEPKALKKEWQPSIELIDRNVNQSALVLGHFGEKRTNPDKFALILANEILGGSTFGSRLGDRLRTDLGYTYGVRSGFGFDRDYGVFKIVMQTKTETTLKSIQEIKSILKSMLEEKPITKEELKLAKERILNRLIFELSSPYQIVNRRLVYDHNGYPPKYLEIFQKKLSAVTLEEVRSVVSQYFFPDRLKIMIVGNKADLTDLKTLGPVTDRPLDLE